MPTTRSSSRLSSTKSTTRLEPEAAAPPSKRKATAQASKGSKKAKTDDSVAIPATLLVIPPRGDETDTVIPAILSFDFVAAKKHLISVDPRFEDLFERRRCTPYEVLETVHPFRSLASSIIGQQISWKAAKSINHKFKRLYDPSLPEDVNEYDEKGGAASFPTPSQVAATDPNVLRAAGLSARKGEYIQDLASRFADGRLTTEKLRTATDEELAEMLIAVKGIGPWTVEMFAIFTLRRPNILPVGDLGVQRGVLRWFLALHSKAYEYSVKTDKGPEDDKGKNSEENDASPPPESQTLTETEGRATTPDASSVAPAVASTPKGSADEMPAMPPIFTPSDKRTLSKTHDTDFVPPPLPAGLTVANMKSRLDTKKKIKGALLTPAEMEALTEAWKPYRSLAVYYMWALTDG